MKGKRAGRPMIPLANISSRKPDGLTGSPAGDGEGDAQMTGQKPAMAKGGAPKKRADKKPRSKSKK